jgi:hypothetical protein
MEQDRAIDLYLLLTDTIHSYWLGFGAITVILVGWTLSRKTGLRFAQRIALTIGWFASAGYLGSGLMNRYKLVAALTQDIQSLESQSKMLEEIEKLSPIYQQYETLVWSSFGFISMGVLILIWTNVASGKIETGKQ